MSIFRILYFIAIVVPSCLTLYLGFGIKGLSLIYSCSFFAFCLAVTIIIERWMTNRYPALMLPVLLGISFGYCLSYLSIQTIQSISVFSSLENTPWQLLIIFLFVYLGIHCMAHLSSTHTNTHTVTINTSTSIDPFMKALRIFFYTLLIGLLIWHFFTLQKEFLNIWNIPMEAAQKLLRKGYDFNVEHPKTGQWQTLLFIVMVVSLYIIELFFRKKIIPILILFTLWLLSTLSGISIGMHLLEAFPIPNYLPIELTQLFIILATSYFTFALVYTTYRQSVYHFPLLQVSFRYEN